MEIKNIIEREKDILLQTEGSLVITKDTIEDWYHRYCQKEPDPVIEPVSFEDLIREFNIVLVLWDKNSVTDNMQTYSYLKNMYDAAINEWNTNAHGFFSEDTYPEIHNYRGDNDTYERNCLSLNAMTSWLMAMCLAELVPTSGEYDNIQTYLYRTAYNIAGGIEVPLYNDYTLKGDPMIARLAAGAIYAVNRANYSFDDINVLRDELGGEIISASSWSELGYTNIMLTDDEGRRGYQMDCLGYLVNTQSFLPNAAGPRIEGTTVCDLAEPWEDKQPEFQFNLETGNFYIDEQVNDEMVNDWDMMAQTPLDKWNGYSIEKKNRLINAAATVTCTYQYMFGAPKPVNLVLENGELPVVDEYPRYVFEENADSNLVIDGPFSDLAGIYRYDVEGQETVQEMFLKTVLDIADNCRFPTQDPNYGRCRPGCRPTREGGELNPVHGADENEIYNISISAMVADTEEQRQKALNEDGWAADSPRSYVSGHSAQIITMALMLGQMAPDRIQKYIRRAYEYSVNRSIARYHWNSDCIYGRLFATMTLPIINAMSGIQDAYNVTKDIVINGIKKDITFNLIINNDSSADVTLDGDLTFVLANPDKQGVYYGWDGPYNRTGHIRFCPSEVFIPAHSSMEFKNVNATNSEVVLRGRNCMEPELLYLAGRPRNVLLYVDGVSDEVLADNIDSNIIFEDNGTYVLKIEN